MLLCQDFGRGHQTGLKTIIGRQQHAHQGHHRFPAPHIALDQAIHLGTGDCIPADFPDHSFLGLRQFKRQTFRIKSIETLPHFLKTVPLETNCLQHFVFQQFELNEKQFVKFQPPDGLGQFLLMLGEVDPATGLLHTNELMFRKQILW